MKGYRGRKICRRCPIYHRMGRTDINGSNGKIDLSMLAEMTQWVNESFRTLGCEKTEKLLDKV